MLCNDSNTWFMLSVGSVEGVLIGDAKVEQKARKTRVKQMLVKLILNFEMAGDVDSLHASERLTSLVDPKDPLSGLV